MGRNCFIPDIIPYNRVETKREMPKLKFASIKLKPKDVESSSIGTALGSYRNYTHI